MDAGHILGAASVFFESSTHNRRVLVSGDYSTFQQETVLPSNWDAALSSDEKVDLLVSESTYGSDREKSRNQMEKDFVNEIKSITSNGGTALIPCFALGRAQEVISILNRAFRRGELQPFKVFIDGMIDKINPIYENYNRLSIGEEFIHVRNVNSGYKRYEVIDHSIRHPCAVF